jgi:hypothetical protein
LVTREFDAADRRRVTLALTARGNAIIQAAHVATQAYLAEVLCALSLTEQQVVAQAMPRFFASNAIYPISIMPAWQRKPTHRTAAHGPTGREITPGAISRPLASHNRPSARVATITAPITR